MFVVFILFTFDFFLQSSVLLLTNFIVCATRLSEVSMKLVQWLRICDVPNLPTGLVLIYLHFLLCFFNKINESIDRAYSTNIVDILITGDFNFNMLSNENNKMEELIQQYNLNQLIREPTHFTEHSASLIDLVLVRNTTSIVTSGVADSFIPDR